MTSRSAILNVASIIEAHPTEQPALITTDYGVEDTAEHVLAGAAMKAGDGDVRPVRGSVGDVITYGELRRQVAQLRSVLVDHGVAAGDRVAILAGNEPTFVTAFLAATGLGAIAVPILPQGPVPELLRSLMLVTPRVLVHGREGAWVADLPESINVPILNGETVETPGEIAELQAVEGDTLAALMLTSGVSAEPKAAMLTHANLTWMQTALLDTNSVTAADRVLGLLPAAHIFGLNVVLLTSLRAGATVYLVNRFQPRPVLDLIATAGLTVVAGVPPMWQSFAALEDAPATALRSITFASSGAAPLPRDVFDAVRDRFGIEVGEGYGLTETSPVVTLSRGVDPRPGSVGIALAGVEIRILEPDGHDVEPGDSGEIWVRGPGVFAGYWNDQSATNTVLSADGWFRTGDIGAFDDDGYLYLVDRVKDLIIVSGFNVYPGEVEEVIMGCPGVNGVIVVGVPDPRSGEAVEAYVRGDVDEAALKAVIEANLSRYKHPQTIHLVDELPITATGKRIRRALR